MYGVLNMLRSLIMQYKPRMQRWYLTPREKPFVMNCLKLQITSPANAGRSASTNRTFNAMVKAMGLPLLAVSGVEADTLSVLWRGKPKKPGVRC